MKTTGNCIWVFVAAALICTSAGAWALGPNPFGNVRDVAFESIANGPQGAIVVHDATGVNTASMGTAAVRTAVSSQHAVARLEGARGTVDLLKRCGFVNSTAEARFPRTIVHVQGNELVTPDLQTAAVSGTQIGAPTNTLTFEFEGWSTQDQAALQSYLDRAVPKVKLLYGAPAFSITVKIICDDTITDLQGGTYDITTNEIRIPSLSGNFAEDSYTLLYLVINAFHDDVALFYDAWEQGMAGALAYIVQTTAGVSPGYDPVDPGPFYALSVYECENHPELANSTFYPASGHAKMMVWRIAMARAAWLKCYIENHAFFSSFNQVYYNSFTEGLQGNVPALKLLAASVLPQVEGDSFFAWFNRQYVLDTSTHLGPKLYVWNIPLETSVALIADLYTTLSAGDEQPMGGQAATNYWSYDFQYSLYAEEGNVIDIASSGTDAGEGFLLPTFFNIGGAQRISVDVEIDGLQRRYPYPYDERGFSSGENNLYGGIIGASEGLITVTGGDGLTDLPVARGVWGDTITSTDLSPQQLQITYENPLGQTVTRVYNVGWDSYCTFIEGADQTRVTHTFSTGTNGLHLMSLPITPTVSSAPDILNIAADRLLLAEWDPTLEGADKYKIWPDTSPFTPGHGYWLKLYSDASVQAFGIVPPADEVTSVYLPIGWNIIGSPRQEEFAVEDLRVSYDGAASVSFSEAVDNGWVQMGVFGYDQTAGYELAENIESFHGYWFRVLRSPGINLEFPVTTATASIRSANAKSALDWKLPLVVETAGMRNSMAYIGVSSEASDQLDRRFDIQAPPEFGNMVTARFVQPADQASGAAYVSDVRSEAYPQRWELQVASTASDSDIELSWPELGNLPSTVRPVLVDTATGYRQYMRTTTHYAIRPNGDGTARSIAIELEEAGQKALSISSLSTAQSQNGLNITYTLSNAAAVNVNILNIAGRTISRVATGQLSPAGISTAVWNLRSSTGTPVPSGTYIIQFCARTDEGQQTNAIRAVQLQR